MTDSELIIQLKEAVKDTLTELGIAKAKPDQSAFKKTEQLLWNYPNFHQLIKDKEEQIAEVVECGLRTKSKSIVEFQCGGGGTVHGLTTVQESVQEVVDALQYDIMWVKQCLERLELALDKVRKDLDFPILTKYYFDKVTGEVLATEYETSIPTVMKRKNALVRRVALYLFPQDAIQEMM